MIFPENHALLPEAYGDPADGRERTCDAERAGNSGIAAAITRERQVAVVLLLLLPSSLG